MRFRLKLAVGVAVLGAAAVGTAAIAHDRNSRLEAFLHGYEEVPAVSTGALGSFKANISRDGDADRLDADATAARSTATVTQAHVHLGQLTANGGISVWFCANNPPITNAPAGTPGVPAAGGRRARDAHRHVEGGERDRPGRSGHRAGRARGAGPGAARRRGVRERPLHAPKPAARSGARSRTTAAAITDATRAPAIAGALSFRRVADDEKRMRLRGLHHVTAICSDLERTIAFYRDTLGLPIAHDAPSDDDPDARHVWFDGGDGTYVSFMEYGAHAGRRGRDRLHAPLRAARGHRRRAGGVARLPARAAASPAPTCSTAARSSRSTCATRTATSSRSRPAGPASAPAGRPRSGAARRRSSRSAHATSAWLGSGSPLSFSASSLR